MLHSGTWCIEPTWLKRALSEYRADGSRAKAAARPARSTSPRVGVVTLFGPVAPHASRFLDFFGGTSLIDFGQRVDELASASTIDAILLLIDSPGGTHAGTPEAADKVFAARNRKPVVALVDSGMMASAALWIGSAASQVYMTRSSEAGSLGTYLLHIDESAALDRAGIKVEFITSDVSPYKAEFNSYSPLTDDARRFEQAEVNAIGRDFAISVAAHRRKALSHVRESFGRGRLLNATEAARVGMVDGIVSTDALLRGLASGRLPDGSSISTRAEPAWRARNETERLRSKLQRKGILR